MKENTDYEIIPDMNDDKAWNVRILKGAFTETVIKYGVVKFNSEDILFNFDIISSPDKDLTSEDVDLQKYAAGMLENIIDNKEAL
tara:strand:- start:382 stop:636 length:255 start_codon:yes stop_codon:yes gene_type:complete